MSRVLNFDIGVDPPAIGDLEDAELLFVASIAAARRHLVFQIDLTVGIIVLEDEIDHPAIRRKAETLGDFFGEDLNPGKGFWGVVGKLSEGTDADAVDENHRLPAAAAPAGGTGACADLSDQVGDGGNTFRGNRGLIQLKQRSLIDKQLPPQPSRTHNDFAAVRSGVAGAVGIFLFRLGRRFGLRLRGRGFLGCQRQGQGKGKSAGASAQACAGERGEVHGVPLMTILVTGRLVTAPLGAD